MTRHFLLPVRDPLPIATALVEAARCWREARDSGKAVQPSLFALLSRHGHGMLAPVFDSLMTLAEAVFGRRIAVGSGNRLSDDEHRLIGLLEGRPNLSRKGGLASAFDCAVRSTRIMMMRTIGQSTAPLAV